MSAAFVKRLRRLLVLIPYVAKRGEAGVAVEEAAKFAGCRDVAELYADLELARQLELPPGDPLDFLDVEVEDGRVYVFFPQNFREPPRLTVSEGAALLAATRMLGEATGKSMEVAAKKVRRALPEGLEAEAERLAEAERVETAEAPECAEELERAAAELLEVEVEYYAASRGETKRYTLEPKEVRLHRGNWYLVAWSVEKKAEQLYRLDRVKRVKVGGRRFEGHQGPATSRYERVSWYFSSGAEVPVEIRFSSRVAALVRDRWSRSGVNEPDGGLTVKLTTGVTKHLVAWVMGYGGEATVVGPRVAREAMRERVEELVGVYGGDGI